MNQQESQGGVLRWNVTEAEIYDLMNLLKVWNIPGYNCGSDLSGQQSNGNVVVNMRIGRVKFTGKSEFLTHFTDQDLRRSCRDNKPP